MRWKLSFCLFFLMPLTGCVSSLIGPSKISISEHKVHTIVVGKTNKAQLLSLLGQTKSIQFDSGYEVWIYQIPSQEMQSVTIEESLAYMLLGKGTPGKTEFIVLLNPAGIVSKTRVRPIPNTNPT